MNRITDPMSFAYLVAEQIGLPINAVVDAHIDPQAGIQRSKLAQETLSIYAIPLDLARTWDAAATLLPAIPAADDLGLITGTPGTSALSLQTGDVKAAGCTRKARFQVPLPHNYDANQTLTLRAHAGMLTTLSDGAATLAIAAYKSARDGTVGSNLVTTAAQSIKSLTLADVDFTVTPSGLAAGDVLEVILTLTIVDAATATAVVGIVGALELLADTRG